LLEVPEPFTFRECRDRDNNQETTVEDLQPYRRIKPIGDFNKTVRQMLRGQDAEKHVLEVIEHTRVSRSRRGSQRNTQYDGGIVEGKMEKFNFNDNIRLVKI